MHSLRIRSLILIFLYLYGRLLPAQELIFKNLTELNLPSEECYNICQDSKGYIWISTEQGLCRYNGNNVKIYNKANGLSEKSCYVVKEDKQGALWIATATGRILTYANDSLREAPCSKNYVKICRNLHYPYLLNFKDDSLIITSYHFSYICAKNSPLLKKYPADTSAWYYFVKYKNELIHIKPNTGGGWIRILEQVRKKEIELEVLQDGQLRKIFFNYKANVVPQFRVITASNKRGESFIVSDTYLFKLNRDMSLETYRMPGVVLSLYMDKTDGLWIGTSKKGVLYFPNTNSMNNPVISLDKLSVTGICVDRENGVWCTTLEKGVFYSRNINILNYKNVIGLDARPDLFKFLNGSLYYSSQPEQLVKIGKNIKDYKLSLPEKGPLSDIASLGNGLILSGRGIVLKTDTLFTDQAMLPHTTALGLKNVPIGGRQICLTPDKKIFLCQYSDLHKIEHDQVIDCITRMSSGGNCLTFDASSGFLLVGCRNGLYQCDTGTYKFNKVMDTKGPIHRLVNLHDGSIWAVGEDRIYTLSFSGTEFHYHNITKEAHLNNSRFYDLTDDKFGRIWVAGNNGLSCIKKSTDKAGQPVYTTKVYTVFNGLPSNAIYNVAADSTHIFLSTAEGLCSFSPDISLSNSVPPSIYLSSVTVNGRNNIGRNLVLNHKQNSLKVMFDVLTFKGSGNATLLYRLKRKNSVLHEQLLKGNEVILEGLKPGTYELLAYGINNEGIRSAAPAVLRFEIKSPWWQAVWFMLLCIALAGLLVYIWVRIYISRIRRKEEEKTQINKLIAESQMAALQAQMNPHFIFNAINSIQNYILKKQEEDAYSYLAKISKLIRMVLTNSQEKILPLEMELETIRLYIELEQLRFKDRFDFILEISPELKEQNIMIPAMLIQPYIENAIWHGLMNLEDDRRGKLHLRISREDSVLKIVIEDNGVGRRKSAQYHRTRSHKSLGTSLTEQRLLALNKLKGFQGSKVHITDLYSEGRACGTRVEIFLTNLNNDNY